MEVKSKGLLERKDSATKRRSVILLQKGSLGTTSTVVNVTLEVIPFGDYIIKEIGMSTCSTELTQVSFLWRMHLR